jgi:hypothetical protein
MVRLAVADPVGDLRVSGCCCGRGLAGICSDGTARVFLAGVVWHCVKGYAGSGWGWW